LRKEVKMQKGLLLQAIFGGGERINREPPDEVIEEVLSGLGPRERFVLEHRFADKPLTLRAIAKIYPRADGGIGAHPARIHQVEAKVLRRLRHPLRVKRLLSGIKETMQEGSKG